MVALKSVLLRDGCKLKYELFASDMFGNQNALIELNDAAQHKTMLEK
jgi:hypothetical protein